MERHRSESSMGLLNGPQPSNYDSVPNVEINNGTENEDSRYTELLRGSVPCPSCRGLGHIPKGRWSFKFHNSNHRQTNSLRISMFKVMDVQGHNLETS
jgi:hypothetical protein